MCQDDTYYMREDIYVFIRQERSIKEFMQFYPVVAWLIIIHFFLWLIIDLLRLPIGLEIYQWGVGNNAYIHQGEYWRLLTAIFLHSGLMHALFNSFSLVLFGPALEQMLGRVKFIITYLGAGLIGNIATYAFDPTAFYSHLGASGAVFGLFGVYMYMVVMRKDLIDDGNAQIVVIITIIALVMTFVRPQINIYAHIFGLLGGLMLAPVVLTNTKPFSMWRNRRRPPKDGSIQFDPNRWKKRRLSRQLKKNLLWIILAVLVLFGLLGRLF